MENAAISPAVQRRFVHNIVVILIAPTPSQILLR
jgi:hypothetical protein